MPRERSGSALAAAPSAAEIAEPLLAEILNWKQEYALVAALLGPPGAGKTALLERTAEKVRPRKFHVQYVDLNEARELWEVEDFYGWLVRKLKEDWWREIPTVKSARLGFSEMLAQALRQRRQPVLFELDHAESLPEDCAHHLISDLREIQERADLDGEWGRLRCVIAGCVSVYELRRRANSPNLQFRLHILPRHDSDAAEAATRQYLAEAGKSAEPDAIRFLARQTNGELAFLNAVNNYLVQPEVKLGQAERAASLWLKNAHQYPNLSRPAALYLLDPSFKDKADRLLDGAPVAPPSATADIDRYQLAGAWVTAPKAQSHPRFRNGLIERLIRGVRDYPRDDSVDQKLLEIGRMRNFASGTTDLPQLLECLATAWRALSGIEGSLQILARNGGTAFAMDGSSVTKVGVPAFAVIKGNGHDVYTTASRVDSEWALDTHWPESEELLVRVLPERTFAPSVSTRELLRLWSLFLAPLDQSCLPLALQELGRHTLRVGLGARPKKVFVSSTYQDLQEHRRAVMNQLVRRDLLFRGMEFFGAEPTNAPPAEKIVREVRDSDVYLGIFGVRYGSVDPESGLSMTELEFNEAESSGKPMLLYAIHKDALVKATDFDYTTDAKLKALLARMRKKYIVEQFATVEELSLKVYADLGKL